MKLLTLSQLRFLRFAPWSTLTVLLGVTLAVSSIVAVHQISQRVVSSLEQLTPPYLRSVAYLAERPEMSMTDYFELRTRWRAAEFEQLTALMPIVEGTALLGDRSIRVVGLDGFAGVEETLGLALLPTAEVIGSSQDGFQRGEQLLINGRSYRVAFSHPSVPAGMLVTDIGSAQSMLGLSDEALSRIALVVSSPWLTLQRWSDRLLPGFSAGVPVPQWHLAGWRLRSLDAELPSLGFARSVLFNLGALASLALVVAWLLVYQVGVIWLRRRQQTLLRLRQMGVTERELRNGFLGSLCLLGGIASVLGIGFGAALAETLAHAATGYGRLDAASAPLDRWLVSKATGSAAIVCLVGGWIAYRRESQHATPSSGSHGRMPTMWIALVLLTLLGFAGVLLSRSLAGGFLGIAALGGGMLLLIGPVLGVLRRHSRSLGGRLLTRIGLRELLWYPGDLAVAVGALVLALATSVAIAVMVDSFRADFTAMLDQRMVDDLFVTTTDRDLSSLAALLETEPDVERVQRYGRGEAMVAGVRVLLGHTRFDAMESARYGLPRPLLAGECLISERLARLLDLEQGEPLPGTRVPLVVAGVFPGFGDSMPRLLLNDGDARTLSAATRFDRISIRTSAPQSVIEKLKAFDPTLAIEQQAGLRELALRVFEQTFAITRALTFLALIVASVGLYNALLALQLLQQHSRLLLRAMGVSAAEQRAIGRWRIFGVGFATLCLALPLGLAMGYLLCEVINPRAFGWSLNLRVSGAALGWPVASAMVVLLLISLLPTPLEGIVDES